MSTPRLVGCSDGNACQAIVQCGGERRVSIQQPAVCSHGPHCDHGSHLTTYYPCRARQNIIPTRRSPSVAVAERSEMWLPCATLAPSNLPRSASVENHANWSKALFFRVCQGVKHGLQVASSTAHAAVKHTLHRIRVASVDRTVRRRRSKSVDFVLHTNQEYTRPCSIKSSLLASSSSCGGQTCSRRVSVSLTTIYDM